MPIDPLTSLFAQIQEQNRYGPQRAFAQVGQGITQGTNSIVEALQRIAQQKRQDQLIQGEREFTTGRDEAERAFTRQRDEAARKERSDVRGQERIHKAGELLYNVGKDVAGFVERRRRDKGMEGVRRMNAEAAQANAETARSRAEIARDELTRKRERDTAMAEVARQRNKITEQRTAVYQKSIDNLAKAQDAKTRQVARDRIESFMRIEAGIIKNLRSGIVSLGKSDELGLNTAAQEQAAEMKLELDRAQARMDTLRAALVGPALKDLENILNGDPFAKEGNK